MFRRINRVCPVWLGVLVLLFLSACASEKGDWKKARSKDTLEDYQAFLQKYPDGDYVEMTRLRIQEIEFDQAAQAKTFKAFEEFMEKHPWETLEDGVKLNLEQSYYDMAKEENSLETLERYINRFPEARYASEVYPRIQELSFNYRIEVLSSRVVKDVTGMNATWKVKDPTETKGVILKVRLELLEGVKDVHQGHFVLGFMSEGKALNAPCSGVTIIGEDFWAFNEPDSNQEWVLYPEKNKKVWENQLLFAVPIEVNEVYFTKKGLRISDPISIE